MVTLHAYNPGMDHNNYARIGREGSGGGAFGAGQGTAPSGFGSGIRARRLALGYTQEALGKEIGMKDTSVTRLEQRERPPLDRELIEQLARVLQGSPEEILAGYVPPGFPLSAEPSGGPGQRHSYSTTAPDSAQRAKDVAVQQALALVNANMQTLRDLAPDELLQVAQAALDMLRQLGGEPGRDRRGGR